LPTSFAKKPRKNAWVGGQDVFDDGREDSPIELRWLVFRKKN
jgi:hypothetical protein